MNSHLNSYVLNGEIWTNKWYIKVLFFFQLSLLFFEDWVSFGHLFIVILWSYPGLLIIWTTACLLLYCLLLFFNDNPSILILLFAYFLIFCHLELCPVFIFRLNICCYWLIYYWLFCLLLVIVFRIREAFISGYISQIFLFNKWHRLIL